MKKILFYSFMAFILASAPVFSFAQDKYTLLEPLPCIQGTGNNCAEGTLMTEITMDQYIGYVFKFAIALAVFLATVVLIYAGFEYMLSESFTSKSAAKERMKNAVLGLLGALASYLILATIDPRLVQINTAIPPIRIILREENRDFAGQFSRDLDTVSSESRLKVASANSKIKELEVQRAGLNQRLAMGEGDGAEILVEIAKIDQEIDTNKTVAITESAESVGVNLYGSAVQSIYATNYETSDVYGESRRAVIANDVNNAKTLLNTKYNQYSDQLKKIGNGEASQTLMKQKDFYLAQIDEEKTLGENITTHAPNYYAGGDQGIVNSDKSAYLGAKLKEYQANLASPQKVANSGLDKELYDNIMKTRINLINQALTPRT